MAVSIITPVFNRWDLSEKFVASVIPYLREGDELIIVDNASTDGTMSKMLEIASKNKKIKYVRSPENVGFGEGNNLGANLAKNDILIFISNDVVVSGDFITATDEMISKNGKCFVGHRMIDWDSGWNTIWSINETIGPIPYLQGYYLAMQKRHFWLIGGFDRLMFLDYDDLDLCFRAVAAGYELISLPDLPISHKESGSSVGGLSEARTNITMKSLKRFGEKYNFVRIK